VLRIWEGDPYNGSQLSQDGSLTSPVIFKVPPTGGVREVQLWLRHDELSGELVESSYDVTVLGGDDFSPDNSSWVEIAPDVAGVAGTYAASYAVGDILGGDIVPFWVRLTVPNTPETGVRRDIYLKITTSTSSQSRDLVLSEGEYNNVVYNPVTNSLDFDSSKATQGSWISEWLDLSTVDISSITYDSFGASIVVDYRNSTAGDEATATAWVSNASALDTSLYVQVRVQFYKDALVGTTGLSRRLYTGTAFNAYVSTVQSGTIPTASSPGDSTPAPKSVKWVGFFKATVAGIHNFRTVSNDGHRLYIDGQLVHENWVTTASTVTSNGNIYLTVGWHEIEYHYYHADGDDTISSFVTVPSVAERAVALADYSPVPIVIRVDSITLNYMGANDFHYDAQIYDGPDVPELIDPENGFETELFAPELTVFQHNCESVEFQMDMDPAFGSPYLYSWIDPVTPGLEHTTTAPSTANRPPGIWYWRARGILDGVYSEWSEWRFLEILPLQDQPSFFYLHANIGLPIQDPILFDRFLYLGANIGLEPHDPIVDARFVYLHVNVALAVGSIIYPMYDYTPVRKSDFDGDSGAFT
jgi:hypothetical protein